MGQVVFSCPQCNVKLKVSDQFRGRQAKCPKCGHRATVTDTKPQNSPPPTPAVMARDVNLDSTHEAFAATLARAFVYPFKGSGIILIIVATVCAALLELLSIVLFVGWFAGIAQLLFSLYLTVFYISIIASSAANEKELPDWPDLTDFWDDILRPVLLFAGAMLVSWGPSIFYARGNLLGFFAGREGTSSPLAYLMLIWALLYFPMALLAVALFDSLTGLNPLIVIKAILKIPFSYLQACVLFCLVYFVNFALAGRLDAIPILGFVLRIFFSLYMMMVAMRILGLIYHANAARIGWFE